MAKEDKGSQERTFTIPDGVGGRSPGGDIKHRVPVVGGHGATGHPGGNTTDY